MAPSNPQTKDSAKSHPGKMTKLARIPEGAKVHKRPLNRLQPPASTKSRIIYVSSSTPFMSAVKRVRKQLDSALRSTSAPGSGLKNASLHARVEALRSASSSIGGGEDGPVVTVMGTGRAVEKTLSLASWFEQQGDCVVAVKTRTVGTVDDVIVEGDDEHVDDSSRIRKLSCLEVTVRLK